jgi:ABC-type molybdate transport system substrate-binding protein
MLVPAVLHEPIRQAAGIVAASPSRQQAFVFLDFLTGKAGRDLLALHGLFPPD